MGHRTLRLTHLLGRQGKHLWKLWKLADERDAPFALQELAEAIFMASLIHVVAFCLANVFLLKNVCLNLSTCYYGLTSLWNVRGCFLSFHNGVKKLRIVTRHSRRKNAYLFVLHMFFLWNDIFFLHKNVSMASSIGICVLVTRSNQSKRFSFTNCCYLELND